MRSKLWYNVKGLVRSNTYVQYASFIFSGYQVIATVKVFVHASHADTDVDARAMTFAPWTYVPAR